MPELPKTQAPVKSKLGKYVDTTGELSNRSLQLGEWYLRHKIWLRKVWVGFLTLLIAGFGGFSLYNLAEYAIVGYQADERNRAELTKNYVSGSALGKVTNPTPVQIGTVAVFPSVPGKYDFFAEAKNDNPNWAVKVYYKFTYAGGATPEAEALLLPGATQPLLVVGFPTSGLPDNPSFIITKTDWTRLDPHTHRDPVGFMKERLNFTVDNFTFLPAAGEQGLDTHTVRFDLMNDSVYGYWQPIFYVTYKDGGTIVGVKRVIIDTFRAREKRTIELKSFAPSLNVTAIDVVPAVDVFDDDVYIPLGR